MHIDIALETERLIREEIGNSHFRSVDELIKAGVEALRQKNAPKSLVQFFRESPLVGLELTFEREADSLNTRNVSTGEEKANAFLQWADSFPDSPPLSDEAISRDNMYPDRW